MSVRRCQQEVSSAEFAEWMAYAEVSPFGEGRADLMPEFRRKQNVRTQSTADMYKQLDGLIRRQQVQQMMFGAPE